MTSCLSLRHALTWSDRSSTAPSPSYSVGRIRASGALANRRLLRSWPMASLGVISYGVYLWHLDLINEFMKWTGWHAGMVAFWLLASAVLGLAIAFLSASYFGLGRPICA